MCGKSVSTAYNRARKSHTEYFFRTTEWSDTHDAVVHESEPKSYESRKIQTSDLTNLNSSKVHGGKKPFKCEICDYSSLQKGELNQHISDVHEGKKPFKCEICDYSSLQKDTLNQHVLVVHGGNVKHEEKICKFYRSGICRHGRSGKSCDFIHPPTCKKFDLFGYKEDGCKEKKCNNLHMTLCKIFMRHNKCK